MLEYLLQIHLKQLNLVNSIPVLLSLIFIKTASTVMDYCISLVKTLTGRTNFLLQEDKNLHTEDVEIKKFTVKNRTLG